MLRNRLANQTSVSSETLRESILKIRFSKIERLRSVHILAAIKQEREYGLQFHQLESPYIYAFEQFRRYMLKHDFQSQHQSTVHDFLC